MYATFSLLKLEEMKKPTHQ